MIIDRLGFASPLFLACFFDAWIPVMLRDPCLFFLCLLYYVFFCFSFEKWCLFLFLVLLFCVCWYIYDLYCLNNSINV